MPAKRWIEQDADPGAVRRLADSAHISRLAATVLVQRGYTDVEAIEAFRSPRLSSLPSPDGLAGIDEALSVILEVMESGKPICVYGDFDVDGVTAAALLSDFFRAVGHPVSTFIPERMRHGYGFHPQVVRELADQGVGLIITVDTGITDIEACREASRLGVKVVITDHHEIPRDLPPADAIINPHQEGCAFHDEGLTGVGLAFFLAAALRAELDLRGLCPRSRVDLRDALDLVALGTIADVAPVTGVNRILITAGLPLLGGEQRVGIKAMKKIMGTTGRRVSSGQVAFGLAPRINAAGRMSRADTALELLTTRDPDRAADLAKTLEEANNKRRGIESDIQTLARKMVLENPHRDRLRSLVLVGRNWHTGVIGIVAGRIAEEFHRPTIVIGLDGGFGKGSGRSIKGFDMHKALLSCSKSLEGFGGHRHAVGLTIRRDKIAEFMMAFEESARAALRAEDLEPTLSINAFCKLEELDERAVTQIESFAPFGIGNPRPVFASRRAKVIFKTVLKDQHLKLRLAVGHRAISAMGWRMAKDYKEIGVVVDLAFQVEMNEFRGSRQVQLNILDIQRQGARG